MLKQLFLLSAGLMLTTTGCGGLVESDEMNPRSDEKGLGRPSQHCVASTFAQPKGQPMPQNLAPTRFDCFDTFADAISSVSKGTVRLPTNAKPEDLKQEDVDRMASMAVYVIAVEYEHDYFGGASYTLQSDVTCQGWYHGIPSLPYGWDNLISSAIAYSGCNNSWHYENPGYTGAVVNCGTACAQIGAAMNDRTSSIIWSE